MTQPRPNYFQTSDPRFITPGTVDSLRNQRGISNDDTRTELEKVRDNLLSKLLGGFTSVGKVIDSFADALAMAFTGGLGGLGAIEGWASRTDGLLVSISDEQTDANRRLDDLESFTGTGVTTPIWVSIGGRDIATVPDSLMMRVEHQDRSGGNN